MQGVRQVVCVPLGERAYSIVIGSGLLSQTAEWLQSCAQTDHVVLISDANVSSLYTQSVSAPLLQAAVRVTALEIGVGERSKSLSSADALWQKMLEHGTTRNSVVVALGGGVVGDVAGFVAATYARGLKLLQIPTTLLAQVDSSVGGKVGINLPKAKNMVGAFWQPSGVLIDTDTLATLADREFRAGLAEVAKYGAALDAAFFSWLEEHAALVLEREPEALAYMIGRCCELKAAIVAEDERETSGRRAVLNYGHTFAHAFEALTDYDQFLHGEAVAMGMMCAARLGERLGRIDAETVEWHQRLLERFGLPTAPPKFVADEVLAAMQHDKKATGRGLRFVLLERLGQAELVGGVSECDIRAILEA